MWLAQCIVILLSLTVKLRLQLILFTGITLSHFSSSFRVAIVKLTLTTVTVSSSKFYC
jgi:hypothetical protein